MPTLQPILVSAAERRDTIRDKAIEGAKALFPLESKQYRLEVEGLAVTPEEYSSEEQKRALLEGRSLSESLRGSLVLKNKQGEVVEKTKPTTLLHLPWFTPRHTFIVDGNEYSVSNQIRLRPGVYTRRRGNAELETQFNLVKKGGNFSLTLEPETGNLHIKTGTSSIPLYPVLRSLGVSHADIGRAWGEDLAAVNERKFGGKAEKAVAKLYEKFTPEYRQTAATHEAKVEAIREHLNTAKMDPEVVERNLGIRHETVKPETLLKASGKLLNVFRKGEDVDDRDSLEFKRLHSADDFIKEKMTLAGRELRRKIVGKLDHSGGKPELSKVVPAGLFTPAVKGFLTTSDVSSIPTQYNPMEILDISQRITPMGEGGIGTARALPMEARQVHHTHLGIIDPIRSTESEAAGADVRAGIHTMRDENGTLYSPVRNAKTDKLEYIPAAQLSKSTIAFPNQDLKGEKSVDALVNGELQSVSPKDVDYIVPHTASMYSPATNVVPLIESMQGNRALMAAKMQTQALSLKEKEAPWVQVESYRPGRTMQQEFGEMTLPVAKVSGTVAKIDKDYIYIRPHGSKTADRLPGGLGDDRPDSAFDSKQLAKGIQVELEHTKDHGIAKEIAKDHLTEDKDYYVKLEKMERRKTAGVAKRQKTINGIVFKIELEPGDKRTGVNAEGKKWSKTMYCAYGYVPKTEGDDGETVDIYLNEKGTFEKVYVVHQLKKDGKHDEDKCMVGWSSAADAKAAYKKHGPEWGYGSMDTLTWDEFKDEYLHERRRKTAADDLVKVPYDTYFPLATKTYLHNDVTVKEGDEVKEGQPLATSNWTKDGTLALGKNLRVGMMAYRGMNSNDAIVISEGAAKKLTSEHLYKERMDLESELSTGKDKHRTYFGKNYTAKQYDAVDEDGVVKKGQTIEPGDPIFLAMRKNELTADAAILGKLHKSLVKPWRDSSHTWEHGFPGKVVDVVKTPKTWSVTVYTEEPMQVGDKLCYDGTTEVLTSEGWKRITEVSMRDRICSLQDENRIEYVYPEAVHKFPAGERMYKIKSQQVDLLVTEGHKMYVQRRGQKHFELLPARDIYKKRVSYKKAADWLGSSPSAVRFPTMTVRAGQSGNGTRELPEFFMPVRTYLMLLGMFLSEGSVVCIPKSGTYGIEIPQTKSTHRKALIHALEGTGLWFTPIRGENGSVTCRLHSKQLWDHFKQFGHAKHKYIPAHIFDWGKEDLKLLLHWLVWGDGHTTRQGRKESYFTISKRLADDVQRLALHVGIAANVSIAKDEGPQIIKGVRYHCQTYYRVALITKKLTPTVNHSHVKTQKAQREEFVDGYVEPVYCVTVPGNILYVRRNGKPVFCGNSGNHGNKGVVSTIVSDDKMVRDEQGRPLDVLLTSAGVISRINPSQVIEMAVAKVAEKTGKPIAVPQFSGRDNVQWAKDLLKEHGLTDKETVYDPVSGKHVKNVNVGPMYMLKLMKTTSTNYSARGAGSGEVYDVNLQPGKGGEEGSKGLGRMEVAGLIAHNARNILRENAVLKSSKNDEFWKAIQLGLPPPAPKTTFAYQKFGNMLTGAGVKFDKTGDQLRLGPLTDKDVEEMSSGAVDQPLFVRSKDLKPEEGGLFDPALTGGTAGTKWSHISLHEPVVNPVFKDPARRFLGMTGPEFKKTVAEKGAAWVKRELNNIDLDKKRDELLQKTKTARGANLDNAVKQLKYIDGLKKVGLQAGDAYVLSKLPVVPPNCRPIMPSPRGDLLINDANYLYRDVMLANDKLKVAKEELTPVQVEKARDHLHDAVTALVGMGDPVSPQNQGRGVKGFLAMISGTSTPKTGFLQGKLIKKQLDLSGRGTIVPDVNLGMDQIGLPDEMLWKLFEPFVVGRLVRRGFEATRAKEMVEERHPTAREELLKEAKERPVIYNRAPSLHRYNLIAAYPTPVTGQTLKIPATWSEPLMSSDYDGNCFSGSTKVVLEISERAFIFISSSYPEVHEMKFDKNTKVLSKQNSLLVETELQNIPYVITSKQIDRNGASVYTLPPGIKVWSYDHTSASPVMSDVTGITIEDDCASSTITTRGGYVVTASNNESLCIYDNSTGKVKDTSPKEAVNKLVPIVNRIPVTGLDHDFEFGWMVGAYVSDGALSEGSSTIITYSKVSQAHRDRFARALNTYEGKSVKRSTYTEEHELSATQSIEGLSVKDHFYHAPKACEFFATCTVTPRIPGRAALSKTLPDLSNFSQAALEGVLVGLLDGDGSISVSNGKSKPQALINFCTSSVALRDSLQRLLRMLGVASSVSTTEPAAGRLQTHTSYTISLSAVDLQKHLPVLSKGINSGPSTEKALGLLKQPMVNLKDIVPLPAAVVSYIKVKDGPYKNDKKSRSVLMTSIAQRKAAPYVSRAQAKNILAKLDASGITDASVQDWRTLVLAEDVRWDLVKTVEPAGNIQVYDLIVPDTKVFAVNGGLVVWDTMQIHTPVTKEAIEDAKRMTLPNLLFGDKVKGKLQVLPAMEAVVGAYKATSQAPSDKPVKKFKTREDALAAYRRGDVAVNDRVEVEE